MKLHSIIPASRVGTHDSRYLLDGVFGVIVEGDASGGLRPGPMQLCPQ